MQLPLWFVEGMAEYLSIGPHDANTAMWLRDAALNDKLAARRIILEQKQNGKLKNPHSSGRTLARILAGDYEEGADE